MSLSPRRKRPCTRSPARHAARRSGFTLLEVMVAVAILALSLTAIFSSEAGAVKMAARARKMGQATLLVRCKMGEIEEDIANKGLPALFASGTDQCCKDGEVEGYSCDWEIEPIILPDNMFAGQMPGQNGQAPAAPGSASATTPSASPAGLPPGNPLSGMLGAATGALGGSQPSTNPMDAFKNIDPTQILAGGGVGGLAAMALAYVYPILKPSFEGQIRRATVTVRWKEGSVPHAFDVTQYLVADQPLLVDPLTGQPIGQPPGTPGAPGAPGTPGATGTPGAFPGGLPGFPSASPGMGIQ